ncbi:DUF1016 N-terminal domain-containing protein [Candidatus Symbiobacter mobilis]|uniref:DUF1016 N-terminal domain-containing protein n=1 Tax=Candidatus Symbiobacter mobilis TaxID=1436290 RepID=UPI0006859F3D|nr:DUF1016 N-terminal domain-containing protein [Candidatus Symbiobacter mobilis]
MASRKKIAPVADAIITPPNTGELMDRVMGILDAARGNVVRAVNSNMVVAYWLIGREIVQALQGGEDRAEYGRQLLDALSQSLSARYGRGFSVTNLKYFRLFYQNYAHRQPVIRHEPRDEFPWPDSASALLELPQALDAQEHLRGVCVCCQAAAHRHRTPAFLH